MKDGKMIIISRLYQEIDVVKQKDSACTVECIFF